MVLLEEQTRKQILIRLARLRLARQIRICLLVRSSAGLAWSCCKLVRQIKHKVWFRSKHTVHYFCRKPFTEQNHMFAESSRPFRDKTFFLLFTKKIKNYQKVYWLEEDDMEMKMIVVRNQSRIISCSQALERQKSVVCHKFLKLQILWLSVSFRYVKWVVPQLLLLLLNGVINENGVIDG